MIVPLIVDLERRREIGLAPRTTGAAAPVGGTGTIIRLERDVTTARPFPHIKGRFPPLPASALSVIVPIGHNTTRRCSRLTA